MGIGSVSRNCSTFKQWFIKLGFWKKLILIFTMNTVIILVVMNVLMEILFGRVNDNISTISNDETEEYISISNSLVSTSIANTLLSGLEVFADLLVQIDSSLHFFKNRTNIYQSLLSGSPNFNPPLTTSFNSTQNFKQTALFVFNQSNFTFHDSPYVHVLMSSMLGQIQQKKIKRVNVIYQSISNPSDIFAITIPATNDFTIPSVQDVSQRFTSLTNDRIVITGLYKDAFTLSSNPQNLLSLRTVEFFGDFRILMETEIYQQTLSEFSSKIFYFPSTQIVMFRITSQSPPIYQLINIDNFDLNLSECFHHGIHQFYLANRTILNIYSIAIGESFPIGQSPSIITHEQMMNMTNLTGSFRLVLLVDKQELSSPNGFMTGFLNQQRSTLAYIIYGWSFVILLATVGLSIVTGNYIFYNLKTLSEKLEQYTKAPSKMHKIIFQLKELECSGVIKKLIDNVITVLEKIEERKKNKNQAISPMIYPLNMAEKEFSKRHNLGDQEKWEEWKQMLIQAKEVKQARQKKNNNHEKKSPQRKNLTDSNERSRLRFGGRLKKEV